jgi:ADP-heptose:LPS heptosyltransferase
MPYDPYDVKTLWELIRHRGFDLALLPADNRYSWLAFALGSRWIVGFRGDRGRYKDWMIDELKTYSSTPQTWGDMVAELIEGPPPKPFDTSSWVMPGCKPFARPAAPYCVLHVGAGNSLRFWEKNKWAELARWLESRGHHVVWSAGLKEKHIVEAIDPERRYTDLAGALDLSQLWHLIGGASLLVCPDTGIAHLARLTNTPAITLYGPGTPVLFGPGQFWSKAPQTGVWVDPFPCRDQRTLYYRVIDWVRRCERFPGDGPNRCPEAKCMQAISLEAVQSAIQKLPVP